MNRSRNKSSDALWGFLDGLKHHLREVREDQKAFTLSLRRTCEYFKVDDGCIAVLTPDGSRADIISVIPRGGQWDLDRLATFLRKQRISISRNILMAPVNRRGRLWAVLALRAEREFQWHTDLDALRRIAKLISESIELMDWQRTTEVRSRIDRQVLEKLRPRTSSTKFWMACDP
jgi:hypothetical protein